MGETQAMIRRPLVHIGYHKTATTWFQQQFYPHVGNARYVPQLDVIHAFKDHDMLVPDDGGLRHVFDASDGARIIVCDETLCGSLQEAYLPGALGAATAQVLAAVVPDADIVIFVRAQPAMLAATYGEYVRNGGTKSPVAYFALDAVVPEKTLRTATIAMPNLRHFEYDRLIARYDALFGAARVHVFLYEQFQQDPSAFLNYFADLMSLEINLADINLARRNSGYSRSVMTLARALNRFGQGEGGDPVGVNIPGMFRVSRSLLHRLNRAAWTGNAPSPVDLFGVDTMAWIERRFAPSNRRLGLMRTLALAENGYPLPSGAGSFPP